ncbi:TPA: capsular biosynthesis protein [Campylobacter coli]|nr:capsular biosynthesis protein [Campylobacter coli]
MIFIMSSAYCSADFELEFGKIPPSFLPLGNKRLYEYQVRLFQKLNETIILTLPQSFQVSRYDFLKLRSLNVRILYIPDNLRLAEALIYAINMNSPINESVYILHGDTYFSTIQYLKNHLVVSKVKENYKWAYLLDRQVLNYNIKEKDVEDCELVLSGFFNIEHPYFLIKCILDNNYSFIDGLRQYSKTYAFRIIQNDSWLDFGLITNYFHSRKSVSTQRAFNCLAVDRNFITKSSSWSNKIKAEINWFKNFPQEYSIYLPRFYCGNVESYQLEYLYLNTLLDLFVFGKLPHYIWRSIFNSIKIFLETIHKIKSNNEEMVFNYKAKTLKRLKQLDSIDISFSKKYSFNNSKSISINEILTSLDINILKKQDIALIHGDFCFSNIMYDFRSKNIKTFDPRGMDFDDNITVYGDICYDYAKLVHSVLGLYDFIISGFARCTMQEDKIFFSIDISDEIVKIQEEFLAIFKIDKQICSIVIHLFASMLPLHADDENRQKALFANIFRLYFYFKGKGLL